MERERNPVRAAVRAAVLAAGIAAAAPAAAETATVPIPRETLRQAFADAFGQADLKLDNFGPKQGNSWLQQQSHLRIGTETVPLSLPHLQFELNVGTALRKWFFYLDEIHADSMSVDWKDNQRLRLRIRLEKEGEEIKGRCIRRKIDGDWKECAGIVDRDGHIRRAGGLPRFDLHFRPVAYEGGLAPAADIGAHTLKGGVFFSSQFCNFSALCGALTASFNSIYVPGLPKWTAEALATPGARRAVARRTRQRLAPVVEQAILQKDKAKPTSWEITGLKYENDRFVATVSYTLPPPRMPLPKKAQIVPFVQKAETTVKPATYRDRCPARFVVEGRVKVAYPGKISYRYVTDRGERSGLRQKAFIKAGTYTLAPWQHTPKRPISKTYAIGPGKSGPRTGWYRLEIVSATPKAGAVPAGKRKGNKVAWRDECRRIPTPGTLKQAPKRPDPGGTLRRRPAGPHDPASQQQRPRRAVPARIVAPQG